MTFSVIDVETTGLSPADGDRIIEIGIAKLEEDGRVLDAFETLINPERRISASHIHGITDEMVEDAPRFRDVLPALLGVLHGSVVAAHNASFDLGFIRSEIDRAVDRPPTIAAVCTLNLARRHLGQLPSLSLAACRRHLNLPDEGAHNALADARSAAYLLKHLRECCDDLSGAVIFELPLPQEPDLGFFDEAALLKQQKPRA